MTDLPNLKTLFPMTKFNNEPRKQMDKVLEEILEAEHELDMITALPPGNDVYQLRQKFLHEVIDVMHAASGILYHSGWYTDRDISQGIAHVQDKNRKRGYYTIEQLPLKGLE